ncbi:NADPH-dependent oxidoreductase [Nocardioides mangrovicus]|uniref:NADPH-dependent oxidoreductase n=1 Tax=Nocardioides mangrovicus TaxID=2478913 RepID=A0A3L8NZS6_9ACTN|nr:NAD(P)H-dependent oxidoreductase [Nocardioides mangrovicus]RLV48162.1 NADPH-dependent oxidoreductase [Nocardioides mangrovicus]
MKLLVVIASTRPGRVGKPVADWFAVAAREHGGFEVDLADLGELDLPLLDEPHHPRLQRYEHDHTKAWSARVAAADAVVFVMPEYNHSFNAALKNAIDYLHVEWAYKPIGFVAYGGVAAGQRAVGALKPVLAPLRAVAAADSVMIPWVQSMIEDGVFRPSDDVAASVDPMLDELAKLAEVYAPLRTG